MAHSTDKMVMLIGDEREESTITIEQYSVVDALIIEQDGKGGIMLPLDGIPEFVAKILKMYSRRASSGGVDQIFEDIKKAMA